MGACDFATIGAGKDLKDAYNNAVEDALYQHGHDPYNGTISTTSLMGLASNAPRYGTKAFNKYVHNALDTMPKWQCYAVEVKGKALKEYRKQHGLERKRIKVFYFFGIAGC